MSLHLNRRHAAALMALTGATWLKGAQAMTHPELALGSVPWLGYGPWTLARQSGWTDQLGLRQFQDISFADDQTRDQALRSGDLQGASLGAHAAMALVAQGVPIKMIMLEDVSLTADALVTLRQGLRKVRDLKGMRVAYEPQSTSHLLLAHALRHHGLKPADLRLLPMTAQEAAQSLIQEEADAAVTYEPYIARLRHQRPNLRLLWSAGRVPGLISDVLALRTDFMKAYPDTVQALMQAWSLGVDLYRQSTDQAQTQIALHLASPLTDLQSGFAGVQWFNLADNRKRWGTYFKNRIHPLILSSGIDSGLIPELVPVDQAMDTRWVDRIRLPKLTKI